MIEFKEGKYVSRIFMFGADSVDMMGCLSRDEGADKFKVLFRYRHHVDAKVWDSADKKTWKVVEGIKDEARGLEVIDTLLASFRYASEMTGQEVSLVDILVIESDDPRVAMEKLSAASWADAREEKMKCELVQ